MLHTTKARPPTEPRAFHRARQKAQAKDIKEYLKGRPFWKSMVLMPVMEGTRRVGWKRIKLQGTYVAPRCMFCNEKDKRCKCLDNL